MQHTRLEGYSINEVLKKCPSFNEDDVIRRAANGEFCLWVWFSIPPVTEPPCQKGWLKVPQDSVVDLLDCDFAKVDCWENETGEVFICGGEESHTVNKKNLMILEDDFTSLKGLEMLRRSMQRAYEWTKRNKQQTPNTQQNLFTAITPDHVPTAPTATHQPSKEKNNLTENKELVLSPDRGVKKEGMKEISAYMDKSIPSIYRWNKRFRTKDGKNFLKTSTTGRKYAFTEDMDLILQKAVP